MTTKIATCARGPMTCACASSSSGGFFDVASKCEELRRLEEKASEPDFWSDQEAAQKVLQQRSRIERVVKRQEGFESAVADAEVLFEFAAEDEASARELRELVARLEHEVSEAETEMLLSGPMDARNAICSIQAGAGGTDAQDWAEMPLRMHLKWAEKRGFNAEVVD